MHLITTEKSVETLRALAMKGFYKNDNSVTASQFEFHHCNVSDIQSCNAVNKRIKKFLKKLVQLWKWNHQEIIEFNQPQKTLKLCYMKSSITKVSEGNTEHLHISTKQSFCLILHNALEFYSNKLQLAYLET